MKYYFFTTNRLENFKLVCTTTEVSNLHPIDTVIDWNKQVKNNANNVFYTLVFFAEISKEHYDMYKANEKYI